MTDALVKNKVSTGRSQVGEQLGTDTMVEYMERFGFYSDPPLDFPSDAPAPSGPINSDGDGSGGLRRRPRRSARAAPRTRTHVPQMAMVAAAVATAR